MNLSDFAQCFRHENAEIVFVEEKNIKVGEYADFFYAFCLFDGQFYAVNDRHPVLPRYSVEQPEFIDSHIFLNRYSKTEKGLELVERFDLDPDVNLGWDPRIVSNGKQAYAIIISNPTATGHETLLYNLRTQKLLPIEASDPDFFHGKNWQPYLVGDELYFVHEMVPFRILSVDVETGNAEIVREIDVTFKLPCFHYTYPMFRGGCNAIEKNGTIFGMGRATSQAYRHHPFFWSIDEDDHLQFMFTEFFSEFYTRGYNVIDPTCIFFDGDDLFFGLACSELDWAHSQKLSHFLIAIRKSKPVNQKRSLAKFLQKQEKTQSNGQANLNRHIFFCIEMPSAVSSAHEMGGRVTTGSAPGHLVHGPYVKIEEEGRYIAELSYFARSGPGKRAGEFDVTVGRLDEEDSLVDFRTLGSIELSDTDGNMGEARIEFDTTGQLGHILEMRVFVEKDVMMNAFHIRTSRS